MKIQKPTTIKLYSIPSFNDYLITEEGAIFDIKRRRWLKVKPNPMYPVDYVYYRLRHDSGELKTTSRHRLLCAAFKGLDIDNSDLHVNHINGIKGDDRLENLEVVTPLENLYHAGRLGLTPKCRPVRAFNHFTKEELSFPSLAIFAQHVGISKDAATWRVQNRKGLIIDGWEIKYLGDETPWQDLSSFIIMFKEKGDLGKHVLVNDVETNKVYVFNRLKDACDFIGIKPPTMSLWLSQGYRRVNVFNNRVFRVQLLNDYNEWEKVEDVAGEVDKFGSTDTKVTCVVKDNDFDNPEIYYSSAEIVRKYNIKVTTLSFRLKNAFATEYGNLRFGFYSDYLKLKDKNKLKNGSA